ncbi:piggyBac transposable element-derived protein 2-like isoform X2 [Penaeus chinensis]|uniref:piggyBac transposable element-derived protein 2-like isoform X2 n=1 Tax=Penaeus chinensis TaxID=139456 RepID=UPI001FB5FBFD|nr:piggyBac transposable element-derived protein 2-like isoform X2 [Penaeus chinensis]
MGRKSKKRALQEVRAGVTRAAKRRAAVDDVPKSSAFVTACLERGLSFEDDKAEDIPSSLIGVKEELSSEDKSDESFMEHPRLMQNFNVKAEMDEDFDEIENKLEIKDEPIEYHDSEYSIMFEESVGRVDDSKDFINVSNLCQLENGERTSQRRRSCNLTSDDSDSNRDFDKDDDGFDSDEDDEFTLCTSTTKMEIMTGINASLFYTRVRNRELCRENTGIVPIEQDNGLSDESSDESDGDMGDAEFESPETGDIDLDPTRQVKMGPTLLTDGEKARILALREERVPIKEIMRRTGRGGKPSAVRKHEASVSTSSPGGAPSSRSDSSEPGPSTSRQAGAAGSRRGCRSQTFLDLLDESDFSESDDDWLPEAVTSAGRLIGVEEAVTSSDSDSEEDLQEKSVSSTVGEPRTLFYLRNRAFVDHAPQDIAKNLGSCNLLKPIEYFLSYVSEDFLDDIAMYTNMKSIEAKGTCINTNSREIATFIGMTFAMSVIKMPRIKMYWQSKTRIPWIAEKMSRDRFFSLRHSLKVIDDSTILEEDRKVDRLWKVRPLLEAIRTRCSELPRPSKVSIDESMIPIRGRISIRQHVPGKPFPDGLKMFVLASPSGMVLDFEIFQTKEALLSTVEKLNVKPNRTITTGEAAVLRFVRSVDAGTSIFFDSYFTSSNLLCDLYDRGLRGTGTIKKNVVPKAAKQKLKTEAALRKEGRGASDCQVRNDNKVAVTAWYGKKMVLMASNEFSIDDEDVCQRWSKASNTHVGMKRPRVVREYNRAMGGVDVHDQIVSYYKSPNRTKKWTVKVVLHMLDVVTANCWLEYRNAIESKSKQYLDFKLILADQLMSGDFLDHASNSQSISDANIFAVDTTDSETGPSSKVARRGLSPLPSMAERKRGASHLPIIIDDKNSFRRCRREGCKNRTRTLCTKCKIFLCNYAKRNCFFEFHV